jgi:nicotinamidase-related amidase
LANVGSAAAGEANRKLIFPEETTMAEFNKWMINPKDAVMLLVDHQSGLFQLVKDIDLPKLRANAAALSKVAHLAKLPTFTTASVPDGPNGPLIPEIHGNNPDAVYIPRTGQINAWDNPKWVEAIEKTGRKTLIIAGTLTSVCMAFPTLSAVAAGYKVFSVVDASGNWSSMATEITLARIVQAGKAVLEHAKKISAIVSDLQNNTDSRRLNQERLLYNFLYEQSALS